MRIAIVGAGGVGGYFGGRLAEAGEDVTFLARGAALSALRSSGLRVDSILGNFSLPKVAAEERAEAVGPVDVVLVCVKAWQVPEVAEGLRPLVGDGTAVVPLQNGVEAADQLESALGRSHVVGGLCRILAFQTAPGHIAHAGVQPVIEFAELDGTPSPRVEGLRAAFARARGVMVKVPGNIHTALWKKFAFIAPVGGVGAVTRAPAGVFRSVPATRRMLEEAIGEVVAVGRAKGVDLPGSVAAETLSFIDSLPPMATASMHRDLVEGRPSELEAQTGAVVRLGAAAGASTPVNRFLYAALLPMELTARGQAAPRGFGG